MASSIVVRIAAPTEHLSDRTSVLCV